MLHHKHSSFERTEKSEGEESNMVVKWLDMDIEHLRRIRGSTRIGEAEHPKEMTPNPQVVQLTELEASVMHACKMTIRQ
ncbi:hypothetical protein MHYP_G00144690 [Metynnis hypsauchen]